MAKMRAYRLLEWGAPPEFVDVDVPVPGPGEVLVKVAAAGICGSDIHLLHAQPSEALLRATNPPNPVDLLVVGTRGSGGFPGTLLGSTSLEIAQCSSIPVTIVPNPD